MTAPVTGRFAGRVAVITGGASGIGEATVRRLHAEGAQVVIADVQDELGRALADELGERTRYLRTDVGVEAEVAALIDTAVEGFGRLDVLFNNAGILGAVGPVAQMAAEEFEFTLRVDLLGVFFGIKHAARVMGPAGGGAIVSTSSPAGMAGGLGPHAYSAAKAGVIGLSASVAAELRPQGIRVNVVVPGAVVSPMTAAAKTGDPTAVAETERLMAETSLLARPGLPADIAAAVAYLASDDAAFVTGTTLTVDAGMVAAPGSSPYSRPDLAGELLREAGRRGLDTK